MPERKTNDDAGSQQLATEKALIIASKVDLNKKGMRFS